MSEDSDTTRRYREIGILGVELVTRLPAIASGPTAHFVKTETRPTGRRVVHSTEA